MLKTERNKKVCVTFTFLLVPEFIFKLIAFATFIFFFFFEKYYELFRFFGNLDFCLCLLGVMEDFCC